MKKRAYMQGKKMPPFRKVNRKLPFDHATRHTLRKQIVSGLVAAIDREIMYGNNSSHTEDFIIGSNGWIFNA